MAITAQDVNKLRKMTGAGMMDCKKALTEADGDFDKAIDLIRKRGQAIASKRADREATEGVALARVDASGKYGAIVVLNCETDFVAKNEGFVALANKILDLAMSQKPANLEALKALSLEGVSVADKVTEQSGVIGEKIELSAYETLEGESITAYIHMGNKLATLVAFNKAPEAQVGKNVAMQVAAMSPVAVDRNAVPQDVKDHELAVAIEKTKEDQVNKAIEVALKKAGFNLYIAESEEHINEGIMKGNITEAQADEIRKLKATTAEQAKANMKEQMVQNIAQGRLNKFFKENTLMEQEFICDNKLSVGQYLDSQSKGLVAVAFKRLSLAN